MIEKSFRWLLNVITSIIVLVIVKNFNRIASTVVWKVKCWWRSLKKPKTNTEENAVIEKAMRSLEENMEYNKQLQERAKELDEREARIEEIEKRLLSSEEAVEI